MPDKVIRVVSAAIVRDGRYLITQRMPKAVFPGLWEFPGGRIESGESDEAALVRELHYRLGVEAVVGDEISKTRQDYGHYTVELHLYACEVGDQALQPLKVADLAWVAPENLEKYEFVPADEESMDALLSEGGPL